jgi:hypothetical protein
MRNNDAARWRAGTSNGSFDARPATRCWIAQAAATKWRKSEVVVVLRKGKAQERYSFEAALSQRLSSAALPCHPSHKLHLWRAHDQPDAFIEQQ